MIKAERLDFYCCLEAEKRAFECEMLPMGMDADYFAVECEFHEFSFKLWDDRKFWAFLSR